MATRSGGVSGVIFALVAFVFLFVLSGALAVLFYTQKTDNAEQAAEAQRQLKQVISQTERTGSEYSRLDAQRRDEGRTIFGQLVVNSQNLKRWLTGDGAIPMDRVSSELETAGVPEGSNALAQLRQIRADLSTAREQVNQLQQGDEQRSEKLAAMEDRYQEQQQQYEQTINGLQSKIDELQASFNEAEAAAREEREQLRQTYEDYKTEARNQLNQKDTKIRSLNNEIAKLQARIDELVRVINANRLSAPDMTLEADGELIEVVPAENVVYINLGRNDNLVLGMTFEVFDAETGVRTEVRQNGRTEHVDGKGTVEVVRFSEDGKTATCRIIRRSYGEPIVKGDLVSNIVYDKDRAFHFFVSGQFDLDQDGKATSAERQRVLNLIRQWGGIVVDQEEMPVDTDFLVIGEQLEFPEPLPDNPPPTPEEIAARVARKEAYVQQQELVGLARELSIPILNQNRFLTLIGYYDR